MPTPPTAVYRAKSQVPVCGVDRDRRLGRGQCPPFGSTAASAPLESWLVDVDERAALVGVERGEGFLAEVALLDEPLVALFDQEAAGQADQAVIVGVDPDHVASAGDLAVDPLQRVCGSQLRAMVGGEAEECQQVVLCLLEQLGDLRRRRLEPVDD